ncbi:hypothetical protein GUJ93_ZPchr0013g35023 [Zizania palustris]|uniref:Polymerase nucleotidyl transferase domain-containing protein n=1 Tax=Zizania palustris TaxID=103762 RepID=A0A8J5WZX0_ZIZPA|nr:hypothetical protein GUJ93_ZPchr0013g35023 [Zizania palustris]
MAYFGGGGGGGWRTSSGRGGGGGGGSYTGGARRGDRRSSSTLMEMMATRMPPAATVPAESMRAAEEAAHEVVLRLHPTEEAERTRQDIIGYLQRLFGSSLGCEVFVFGSVPLKTYLPDGDIDVTILGNTAPDSSFISDARDILESEAEDDDDGAEHYGLRGLRFINAQVKLIKCIIKNIVVDISFNQIGGVSTLCFLELVDREVGKNHLFKRSIMLIKAWCYHEGFILGAHHGLISTYALETLVLYIFNMFHKSLHGPFEILEGSIDRLFVLPEVSDDGSNMNFRLKYLNIIDPLKRSNNLGISVSKGSFCRIRSAFSFGAQRLGRILMLPSDLIPAEILGFFVNTLKRHGRGQRSDLGNDGSLESLLGPEYQLEEDASCLKSSGTSEDENRSPDHSLELSDKESNVKTNMYMISGRYFCGDAIGCSWNQIWLGDNIDSQYYNIGSGETVYNFKQCRKDCTAEEDVPHGRSFMKQQIYSNNQSHILTPSTGDLDLHLGCLRKVQYHMESLFDGLVKLVQEASLSGVLDQDSFKIPTRNFLSKTDARSPGLVLASSAGTERKSSSPVYYSQSSGNTSRNSRTEPHMNAFCHQNVAFPYISNGWALPPSPPVDSVNYPVSWYLTTEDAMRTHGTGMHALNVRTFVALQISSVLQ